MTGQVLEVRSRTKSLSSSNQIQLVPSTAIASLGLDFPATMLATADEVIG